MEAADTFDNVTLIHSQPKYTGCHLHETDQPGHQFILLSSLGELPGLQLCFQLGHLELGDRYPANPQVRHPDLSELVSETMKDDVVCRQHKCWCMEPQQPYWIIGWGSAHAQDTRFRHRAVSVGTEDHCTRIRPDCGTRHRYSWDLHVENIEHCFSSFRLRGKDTFHWLKRWKPLSFSDYEQCRLLVKTSWLYDC